ncbi:MAG: ParB/RepB/Spo0J family partition protein [Nitrosopumilus sp.]|nr:ParB/RepB/Spo0J family partition protein [Nitrosopumilus sp.]
MSEVDTATEIPLEKIQLSSTQARQRDTKVEPDEDLVSSIRRNGLLQPITVKKLDDGNYEIIMGQRRFKAFEILKKPTIKAFVLDSINDFDAKRMSLNENACQKKMKNDDYIDSIMIFMERYGKVSSVAKELGLSESTIRKYLKFNILPEPVKDRIRIEKISIDHANKALRILGGKEDVNPELLITTALELKGMSAPVIKKYEAVMRKNPEINPKEASIMANKSTDIHKLTINVTEDQISKINEFKDKNELEKTEDAASELIDRGLEAAESQ